jgi:hypothetical protein
MFRFTKKPSVFSQYLAKITSLVQTLSVLWRHSMTCVAYVLCTVQPYTLTQRTTHATQVIPGRHNTDNVCTTSISTLNQVCNFS